MKSTEENLNRNQKKTFNPPPRSFMVERNLAIFPHQLSGLKELSQHPNRKRHRTPTSMPTPTTTKGNTP